MSDYDEADNTCEWCGGPSYGRFCSATCRAAFINKLEELRWARAEEWMNYE